VAAVLTAPGSSGAHATEGPAAPVAFSGAVPQGTQSVTTYAQPNVQALTPGDVVASIPLDVAGTISDDTYQARIDPATVPPEAIRPGGLVDLEVIARRSNGESTTTLLTARLVRVGSRVDWADPVETSNVGDSAAGNFRAAGGESVPLARFDEAATDDLSSTQSEVGARLEQFPPFMPPLTANGAKGTKELAGGPCAYPYWEYTKTFRTRPATIGTTYPVKNDVAWMSVSSSQGASYGVASSGTAKFSGFTVSGTRFIQSGWGFKWAASGAQRSYRKGIKYQLMEKKCYGTGYLEPPKFIWRPYSETGGTSQNKGLTRPNWKNCEGIAKGTWWRDSDKGHAYQYGASVKLHNVIGIDLSIKRNYSDNQKFAYDLKKPRRLCGNNDDPAHAGKVMAKVRR